MPSRHSLERAPKAMRVLVWFGACAGLVVGLGSACGPSMQSIHEGHARFEHCYRLDLDEDIATSHRKACWREWSRVYSYGQSRDRIEYARRRVRELIAGDPNPPTLEVDAPEPKQRQFYLSVPAPTNAHAPPPPIATRTYGTAPTEAPGDGCMLECRGLRARCLERCDPEDDTERDEKPRAQRDGTDERAARTETKDERRDARRDADPDARDAGGAAAPAKGCECEADYKVCAGRCFQ